jgi:pimeloyl-ACP methyl ester carboxylesterase
LAGVTGVGLGVAALVIGVASLVAGISFVLFPLALIGGLVGLILGIVALTVSNKRGVTNTGQAIAGVVCCAIALGISIYLSVRVGTWAARNTAGRLSNIAAPTLVLAGGLDMITPPRYGRVVADSIPGARFEVLPEEAHQPFQEAPGLFNTQVDTFWRQVEPITPRCGALP